MIYVEMVSIRYMVLTDFEPNIGLNHNLATEIGGGARYEIKLKNKSKVVVELCLVERGRTYLSDSISYTKMTSCLLCATIQ